MFRQGEVDPAGGARPGGEALQAVLPRRLCDVEAAGEPGRASDQHEAGRHRREELYIMDGVQQQLPGARGRRHVHRDPGDGTEKHARRRGASHGHRRQDDKEQPAGVRSGEERAGVQQSGGLPLVELLQQ
jgi:hypothetical protein